VWFSESNGKIGRVLPDGIVDEFDTLAPAGALRLGNDGALWFAESASHNIGRITIDGTVDEYVLPAAGAQPLDVALGSIGSIWYNNAANAKIGRIQLTQGLTVSSPEGQTTGTVTLGLFNGPSPMSER
jgi:virginiamycin B lyase